MPSNNHRLVHALMGLPVFQAEWILWLLIGLSLVSVAIMLERLFFFYRHRVDIDTVQHALSTRLDAGDYEDAAQYLKGYDSLETNVVLFGLRDHAKGAGAVEDLISGATRKERARFEARLGFLATVASNAPFIGLFGTVLGIIRAFKDLSANMAEASASVMGGIAEALIATAVGLLVAIPAVVAFNYFKARVKILADNTHLLSRTLLSHLKAFEATPGE